MRAKRMRILTFCINQSQLRDVHTRHWSYLFGTADRAPTIVRSRLRATNRAQDPEKLPPGWEWKWLWNRLLYNNVPTTTSSNRLSSSCSNLQNIICGQIIDLPRTPISHGLRRGHDTPCTAPESVAQLPKYQSN